MSEVHDREREARADVWDAMWAWANSSPGDRRSEAFAVAQKSLDTYQDRVEARVRWDQQADAEGYG